MQRWTLNRNKNQEFLVLFWFSLKDGTNKEKGVFIIELLQCKVEEIVDLFDTLWGFFIQYELHTACDLTILEAEARIDRPEFERLKKSSKTRRYQCQLKEQIREWWEIPREEMICGIHYDDDKLSKNSLEAIWSFAKTRKDSRRTFLEQFSHRAQATLLKSTEKKKVFGAAFIEEVCSKTAGLKQKEIHHNQTNQNTHQPSGDLSKALDCFQRPRKSNVNYDLNTSTRSEATQPRASKRRCRASKVSCSKRPRPTLEHEKQPRYSAERSATLSVFLSFMSDQCNSLEIHLRSLGTKMADCGVDKDLQAIYMIVRTTRDKIQQQAQGLQAPTDKSQYGSSHPAVSDDMEQEMASMLSVYPDPRGKVSMQRTDTANTIVNSLNSFPECQPPNDCNVESTLRLLASPDFGDTILHQPSNSTHEQEGHNNWNSEDWSQTGESSMYQLQQDGLLSYPIDKEICTATGADQETPQNQLIGRGTESVLQLDAQQPVNQCIQGVSNRGEQPISVAMSIPSFAMESGCSPAANMDFSTPYLEPPLLNFGLEEHVFNQLPLHSTFLVQEARDAAASIILKYGLEDAFALAALHRHRLLPEGHIMVSSWGPCYDQYWTRSSSLLGFDEHEFDPIKFACDGDDWIPIDYQYKNSVDLKEAPSQFWRELQECVKSWGTEKALGIQRINNGHYVEYQEEEGEISIKLDHVEVDKGYLEPTAWAVQLLKDGNIAYTEIMHCPVRDPNDPKSHIGPVP
ncbi:MAG: hypothetical protein Q9165_008508 [Trypethelium subeluteriae]